MSAAPGDPFLLALAGAHLALVALDLWDRHRHRASHYGAERLRAGSVAFLGVVVLSFLAIQAAVLALAPSAQEILERVRAAWVGPSTPSEPASGLARSASVVLCFYTAGLWDYLVHRHVSHRRWLWFTHEYHHLPRHVFLTVPGVCGRPFLVVTVSLTALATALTVQFVLGSVGLPPIDSRGALHVLAATVVVGTASHSSFLRRRMWAHRAMRCLGLTTPQEHVLHHTVAMDGNFGNFVTLWDRLLGTYLDPGDERRRALPLGLPYDQDFLGTLTLGRFKLSRALRERFQLHRYCNLDPPGALRAGPSPVRSSPA
jgi:sterol desaturase/sphingolipid hydroxylase (fatty acid hydroxylase superfamily)